jgi:hypothetical protein
MNRSDLTHRSNTRRRRSRSRGDQATPAAHAERIADRPEDRACTIGMLCVAGDWACTQADFSTLGDVAARLVEYTHGSLHREVATLAELCRCGPDRAVAAWYRIKELVLASDVQP